MLDPLEQYGVDLEQGLERTLIGEIAKELRWVAEDILRGDIEPNGQFVHITDMLELAGVHAGIRQDYGATNAQIEQAIMEAKRQLVEEDPQLRMMAIAIGTWSEEREQI